jgi:hypothetical protein
LDAGDGHPDRDQAKRDWQHLIGRVTYIGEQSLALHSLKFRSWPSTGVRQCPSRDLRVHVISCNPCAFSALAYSIDLVPVQFTQRIVTMPTSRRDFIKQAAILSGIGATGLFPESIRRAMAIEPQPGSTFLDAEHIVVLM